MAQSSWPSPDSSRTVTDLQYERLVTPQYMDGLSGSPTDAALVTADGSGMHVFVAASRYGQVRGRGWTSGTSALTLTISSNTSGATRTDLVVLGLSRSTWDVTVYVKTGTPGSGAPSLQTDTGDTGTYEIPLAEVTVINGASAISSSQVKTRHWYARPDGVASAGADTRPPSPWPGMRLWENGSSYVWNGSIWEVTSGLPSPVTSTQSVDVTGAPQTPPGFEGTATWIDVNSACWTPVTFTVPQSGRVAITIGGWIENRQDTSSTIWLSYRGSGGGFTAGTSSSVMNPRGLSVRNGRLVASKRRLFTGLTPGATVTLIPVYFTGAYSGDSNVSAIRDGNLIVEPMP